MSPYSASNADDRFAARTSDSPSTTPPGKKPRAKQATPVRTPVIKTSTAAKASLIALVSTGIVWAVASGGDKPSSPITSTEESTSAVTQAQNSEDASTRVVFVSARWTQRESYYPETFNTEAEFADDIQTSVEALISDGYRITAIFPTTKGAWSGTFDRPHDPLLTGGVGYGQTSGVIIVAQR